MERCLALLAVAALCFGAATAAAPAIPRAVPPDSASRMERYFAGAALLDAGDNEAAARFFEDAVSKTPGLVELAEGLIEARRRLCEPETALAFIERSVPRATAGRAEALRLYLSGARARFERDFGNAAFYFTGAAAAAEKGGDPFSAAFYRGALARSLLEARDTGRAIEEARKMDFVDSREPPAERLFLEKSVLEAACLGAADSLDAAERLYRATLSRASAHEFIRVESVCLTGLGGLEGERRRDREALTLYERALVLERAMESPEEIAALLNSAGQIEVRLGATAAAGDRFREAERIVRECGLEWILGFLFYGLGALAEKEGDVDRALTLFQQSLALHRENANGWGELAAHLRLGNLRTGLGDYAKAVEHLEYAREAYEEMGSLDGLSWALGGLAAASHKLGDFEKAERYYRAALDVRRRIGDEKGAAWCLNSLGMITGLKGRYREALSFEHEAMAISGAIGDRGGIGEARFSIGFAYFYLGSYREALRHYEAALEIANETGNRELLGRVVSGMGAAYAASGRLDLAEELYRRCLARARASRQKADIGWALINLASLLIDRGEPAAARTHLEEAIAILPPAGLDHLRSRAFYLLGKTGGSPASSREYVERALSLAEASGLEELTWRCLTDLAELYLALGDTAKSYATQHRAIVSVESLRRLAGSDELRRHLLEPAIVPYERIVSLILARPERERDVKEAFSYTERCRAQILSALLRAAMDRSAPRVDENFRERERELLSKLTFCRARLQEGAISPEERARLLGTIDGIERDFVKLSVRLGERDRMYVEALYPTVEQPDELLAALGSGECMLSYFLGERESHLFIGKGSNLKVHALPPRSVIEEKVGRFLSLLQQCAASGANASSMPESPAGVAAIPREVIDHASRELFAMLIGPAANELDSPEPLVILPDGLLNRLPFALLRGADGRYLVQKHDIAYAPSLRTLRYLRERNGIRFRSNRVPKYHIIAIGASGEAPGGAPSGSRVYPFTEIPIEPLPGAAGEAKEAASLFARSLVLTGQVASEEALKGSPLDDTGVLHIAAHAYIDDEDLRRSFIVLNPARGFGDSLAGSAEDGIVQWHEIASLKLNAALVTLSACRSAGGTLAAGEGISGLTQTLLYAGSGCVLASLLEIPDEHAGALMLEVYRNIRGGKGASAALGAAQRSAIERGDALAEPAVWGAFAAIGDGGAKPRLARALAREQYAALAFLAVAAAVIVANLVKRRGRF